MNNPNKNSNILAENIKLQLTNYYNNVVYWFSGEIMQLAHKFSNKNIVDGQVTDVNVKFVENNNDIYKYKIDFISHTIDSEKVPYSLTCLYNIKTNLYTFKNWKSYQINNLDQW